MSDFEAGAWAWYWENVTSFTLRSGAVAALISEELSGASRDARAFFLRALSLIDATMELVEAEKRRDALEARRAKE